MRRREGFSLLSVLVAMVLMGFGVLALSQALLRAQQLESRTDLRVMADVIAGGYMEEILTRDPRTLVSESPVRVDESGDESESGAFVRTLIVEQARRVVDGDEIDAKFLHRVTVRVSYSVGGRERQSSFVSLVYASSTS